MSPEEIEKSIESFGTTTLVLFGQKRFCWLVLCNYCKEKVYKQQSEVIKSIRNNRKFYCSQHCRTNGQVTRIKIRCKNCDLEYNIIPAEMNKKGNNFCSRSCSATYNNTHKKFGTRRSKLEVYLEKQIRIFYPNLKFDCNQKSAIKSELDFYFPELNLAIEINGIYHYQPIHGEQKFKRIQQLDADKKLKCRQQGIKLIEIDCSQDKYLNQSLKDKRFLEIRNIIDSNLEE